MSDPTATAVAAPAAPANPKHKHHYAPVFYTKAWLDPTQPKNVLCRYRPGQHPRMKGPEGVGYENRFYDAPELPPEDNNIEDKLMEMENIAAPHIHKLRRRDIANFTAQEKAELATFLSLLLTRTLAYREMLNSVMAQLHRIGAKKTLREERGCEKLVESNVRRGGEEVEVEKARDAMQALADGNVVTEQTSKAWFIKEMFMNSEKYDALFVRMRWNLLEAPEDTPVITSDNSVLVIDPARAMVASPRQYRSPSFAMQLQFPISPKYMLVGSFMGPNQIVQGVTAEQVRRYNENVIRRAHKDVYASYRSDAIQAEVDRVFKERDPLIPTLPDDVLNE